MISESAKHRLNMFCACGGFWYIGTMVLGWALIAGFLPPHRPSAGADEIAFIFQSGETRIRIGMVLTMIGAALCIPYTAIMARYIARIEGGAGVLTYGMIMGGIGNVMLSFYPAIFWLVAAYRPDRSSEIVYVLNDWAWLALMGGATIFWPIPLTLAYAALSDVSADRVFPRWSGYVALWMFFMILPDQLVFFFKTGPFAWNGLFGLWLPLLAFSGLFAMSSIFMVRAMKRGVYPDSK